MDIKDDEIIVVNENIEIFCCYARKDKDLLDEFKTHLMPLQRQNLIKVWHDGDIDAGIEWEKEIKKHLSDAKIILLFISPDFVNSNYCYSTEMEHALRRHKQNEARVIPVILRPIHGWEKLPPGDIQLESMWRDSIPKIELELCDVIGARHLTFLSSLDVQKNLSY